VPAVFPVQVCAAQPWYLLLVTLAVLVGIKTKLTFVNVSKSTLLWFDTVVWVQEGHLTS